MFLFGKTEWGLCEYVIVHTILGGSLRASHSGDLAGWQAKMASIEIWIPWRNAHKPHSKVVHSVVYCHFPLLPSALRRRVLSDLSFFFFLWSLMFFKFHQNCRLEIILFPIELTLSFFIIIIFLIPQSIWTCSHPSDQHAVFAESSFIAWFDVQEKSKPHSQHPISQDCHHGKRASARSPRPAHGRVFFFNSVNPPFLQAYIRSSLGHLPGECKPRLYWQLKYSAFNFSFHKLCLILTDWFLIRFPPNFQERFLMSSTSPEFVFWGPKIKQFCFKQVYVDRENVHKNLNSSLKLKITTRKENWGKKMAPGVFSWKFEENRTRNQCGKIKQSLWKTSCTWNVSLETD